MERAGHPARSPATHANPSRLLAAMNAEFLGFLLGGLGTALAGFPLAYRLGGRGRSLASAQAEPVPTPKPEPEPSDRARRLLKFAVQAGHLGIWERASMRVGRPPGKNLEASFRICRDGGGCAMCARSAAARPTPRANRTTVPVCSGT